MFRWSDDLMHEGMSTAMNNQLFNQDPTEPEGGFLVSNAGVLLQAAGVVHDLGASAVCKDKAQGLVTDPNADKSM
jgi:hypothetical protein